MLNISHMWVPYLSWKHEKSKDYQNRGAWVSLVDEGVI